MDQFVHRHSYFSQLGLVLKLFSPTPPSNFSASTFLRMTFHIYIYIVILIKFYKKKRERDIGREKLKYQAELTKISAGTKPQRFRLWY